MSAKPLYKANDELSQKISLFRGDITKLEIDAVANAGENYALTSSHCVSHTICLDLLWLESQFRGFLLMTVEQKINCINPVMYIMITQYI